MIVVAVIKTGHMDVRKRETRNTVSLNTSRKKHWYGSCLESFTGRSALQGQSVISSLAALSVPSPPSRPEREASSLGIHISTNQGSPQW